MYEELLKKAEQQDLYIYERSLSPRLKGLQANNVIWINKDMSDKEKHCVLAEEMIHSQITIGNILDQTNVENRKQEILARKLTHYCLVPFSKIVQAFESGVYGRYELAEYLNVTEEFLQEALNNYESKYGLYTKYKQYIIHFNPLNVVNANQGVLI